MNVERLTGIENYEELSNEPAFSKMVKEWKAYRSTGLSPADIATLTARAEAAEAERDAAVEDMTAVLKRDSDDICAYCKNLIECKGEGCECFEQGKGGTIDGKEYPDFKWTCMDFDYGTCSLLEDTPCNGCIEDDCKGFEWRGPQAGKGAAPNE